MLPEGPMKSMVAEVTRLLHVDERRGAAQLFLDYCNVSKRLKDNSPKECDAHLVHLWRWLTENDGLEEAAGLMWRPEQFTLEPACARSVWDVFSSSTFFLLMGAGSMGKSFTVGARVMLEWARDPLYTTVKVLGPTEDHLQQNLFSHLVNLHRSSLIPLPGQMGDLFIGMDRKDKRSSISGVIVPIGQNKRAGRLQGGKRFPRPKTHPQFGPLSRLFIFLDEAENIPNGIWWDLDNVMANLDEANTPGLRIGGAFNPSSRDGQVGKRCEPPFGWDSFDPDKHYRWTSKRGWEVLRLDALKSENVVTGKVVYPGIQTRAGLEQIIKNSGGTESAGYYIFVRACFPPLGTSMSVVPSGILRNKRGEYIWLDKTTPVGACDLALEGHTSAVFVKGSWGLATGYKLPPSLDNPKGMVVMFRNDKGAAVPRYGLQVEQMFALPKGDTVKMSSELIRLCRGFGIKPEWMCVDRTGHGQGIYDLMRSDWSPAVIGVNYSESASEKKVMIEDTQNPKEEYTYVTSELWFAFKKFVEFGYWLAHPSVEIGKVIEQATTRLYKITGGRSRVETKTDYISRGFPSPDEADANTLLVHAVRCNGVQLSMNGVGIGGSVDDDEGGGGDWWYRSDPSSIPDYL